ncbi:MAG: hypothetical protein WAU68_04115 [Vitreimonas sp.]
MALIVLHDTKQNRDLIINADNIFQCIETEGGVRIHFTEGSIGRDHCLIAGTLDDFANKVGALRVA